MKLLIAILGVLISYHAKAQKLEFYKEDITFEIKNNHFYVDGDYYFANQTLDSSKTMLFYPFPLDNNYGDVDSVKVKNLSDSCSVIFNYNKTGAFININIAPYSAIKYKISYRQKLLQNKAEYILLTTKNWGKPFVQANYKLLLNNDIKVDSISYKADSESFVNGKLEYVWEKNEFMPDRNFIVYFRRKE